MITEDDLVQAIGDLADLAPDECSRFEPRSRRAPHRLIAAGSGSLVAAAVAIAALIIPSALTHSRNTDTQPRAASTQVDPVVRAQLVRIARADATANGDPTATAVAVKTTYQRLRTYDRRHYLELVFMARQRSDTANSSAGQSLAGPLWVIELRGVFDGGNTVLDTFVDGASLRELAGAANTDTPRTNETTLGSLGTVVRLISN